MSRFLTAALATVLSLAGAAPALADKVTVKLGTLAPDGSPWHLLLKEMAEKWGADSGGQVKVRIFPGGIQGNEGDVIRKMRVGQLQAAAVSIVGLRDIDPASQALGTPGLIESDEELAHVYSKCTPVWEKRLEERGFIVLSWGDTGWVRIFVKREGRTPSQLKGLKVFAWAGDPGANEAWKAVGMNPVVISSTDMLPALSTGMIEAFATTPILAMTARWYEQTQYMPDVNWGRLAGATIMTKEAWAKIPEEVKPKLRESAKEIGAKINAEVNKMHHDSIEAMKRNGLKVLELTEADRKEWQAAAEKTWPIIRSTVVAPEDFDLVLKARDEFRALKGKK